MHVLQFLIGLGFLLWGIICLLIGIMMLSIMRPPYGIVGFIFACIGIPVGYFLINDSDMSGTEDLKYKRNKMMEKEHREAEIRKQQFMEQEQWKKERMEGRKQCPKCKTTCESNVAYCMFCGFKYGGGVDISNEYNK